MNMKHLVAYTAIWLLACTSCIKDEAPNAEADIVKCILPESILSGKEIDYNLPFDESLNAYPIHIEVNSGTDLTALAPAFELTPGSGIEPASGTTHDFTRPVRYTTTSEDGKWHRTYALIIHCPTTGTIPTAYHFETVKKESNYYVFYEAAEGHSTLTWASGNQGFSLTGGGNSPDDYPTSISPEGRTGNCLKLVTRTTGDLGNRVGKPIAAGNLFMGKFELLNALGDALAATKFGVSFHHRPTKLTGYYKYKAGPRFYENGEYTDRKDVFNIYALFYEKDAQTETLDGHIVSHNYTHPNMVALAIIDSADAKEADTWTRFELPFDYGRFGKEVDPEKLANGQYNISVILSASKNGDQFKGAPGSTLLIDDLEIEYE